MPGYLVIADDNEMSRTLLAEVFRNDYDIIECVDGKDCLSWLLRNEGRAAALILDMVMPSLDGMQVLKELNDRNMTKIMPVFCITGHRDQQVISRAYKLGAMDFITKPIFPDVVSRRVNVVVELFEARKKLGHLVTVQHKKVVEQAGTIDSLSRDMADKDRKMLEQALTISSLNRGMAEAMATAIEFRSNESSNHVRRISAITRMFFETELGSDLTQEEIDQIATAAIMHDVGKISIPDDVLNKPGRLTPAEFVVMKQHTVLGAMVLKKIPQMRNQPFYRYAYDIALCHHERWDGGGYPRGIKGDDIPLWAQVVSIADVIDALVSRRVYKDAIPFEKARSMILKGDCGVFNPRVISMFEQLCPALKKLYAEADADE
ncbi:MAG: response regulator [Desulfovibrio sp.]|nr:response regulator [Desulfovibrio sp.]